MNAQEKFKRSPSTSPMVMDESRRGISQNARTAEETLLKKQLKDTHFSQAYYPAARDMADRWVNLIRGDLHRIKGFEAFAKQYDLSNEEGVALMCLAEALLRIPDASNIDALIEDKLVGMAWHKHIGQSPSTFVNVASWGLLLTGKALTPGDENYWHRLSDRMIDRLGSPVIRKTVRAVMYWLGSQFVCGETIDEALKNARSLPDNFACSFDMLGEAAITAEDAERYFLAYRQAIESLAQTVDTNLPVQQRHGISVKLSALHPRFERSQEALCVPGIVKKMMVLACDAHQAGIPLTIDAEEADRTDLTLEIFRQVWLDPSLKGYLGFGLAVQAYQKRALQIINWLADLAKTYNRTLNIRLIKGAYWDYEIKNTQERGLTEYPVYTRKESTDANYLICTQRLSELSNLIFPQFATHNALTIAMVSQIMGDKPYEFQCLHGMGDALYRQVLAEPELKHRMCRIYAPVGVYQDLLPYLVRRLLENGANTSFINQILDTDISAHDLLMNPPDRLQRQPTLRNDSIPLPRDMYPDHANSGGYDLSDPWQVEEVASRMNDVTFPLKIQTCLTATPPGRSLPEQPVTNPATGEQIGILQTATESVADQAITDAREAWPEWQDAGIEHRAGLLEAAADLMEDQFPELMALVMTEAGKTWDDAIAEIREAIDFLRYYAANARSGLKPLDCPGPVGEENTLHYQGRGLMVCISPWNFPMAIFLGQVSAALVSGNVVIAKPASQTVFCAARLVEILYEVGVPRAALQLLAGARNPIGKALIGSEAIDGIMLTGSTGTAKAINRTIANREGPIIPLIAETGGQNAMIVDSTALPEQVVKDVVDSAFRSAGQRCSACRVLYLQEETADSILSLLIGAMAELSLGDPRLLSTDVGPIIDEKAKQGLEAHENYCQSIGKILARTPADQAPRGGSFFAPLLVEIDDIHCLKGEVFGPILHVIRYKQKELDQVIEDIHSTGFGLTFGLHTRIMGKAYAIAERVRAGNVYVNRNMIGAVVGVQPFGGQGLSGTGPKAGGPNYLHRLCQEKTVTVNLTAVGGNAELLQVNREEISDE